MVSLVLLVESVEVVDDVVVGGVPCVAFLEAFAFYFAEFLLCFVVDLYGCCVGHLYGVIVSVRLIKVGC